MSGKTPDKIVFDAIGVHMRRRTLSSDVEYKAYHMSFCKRYKNLLSRTVNGLGIVVTLLN